MDKGKFSYQSLLRGLEEAYGGAASERVRRVLREAVEGHQGQFRASRSPEHRLPFVVHPVGTARLAIEYYRSAPGLSDDIETVVCVALAHDLLEDTRIDGTRIQAAGGAKVWEYVEALTKPPAGVAGRSAGDRNREFVDQIAAAGPTAAFVKICDSMHNLTRPALTPAPLMRKMLDKAQRYYLPLLDRCGLGETIRRAYEKVIAEAEESLVQEAQYARQGPAPASQEDAVAECIAASTGKVLELHDISAILARIASGARVSIWRHVKGDDVLSRVTALGEEEGQTRIRAPGSCESAQRLAASAVPEFRDAAFGPDCALLYTVPMRTDAETTLVAVLAFGPEGPPVWLSLDFATMQIQFLAHRLIVSEADRRSRLASTAAALGMQLDVDVAARVGVLPVELNQLEGWRNRCRQAVAVVEHLVAFFLLSKPANLPLAKLAKVESRVKTVDSILRKYLPPTKRVWPEYQKLEDIAGVRVICPTRAGLEAVEQFLLGEKAAAAGVRIHGGVPDPRRDYAATPTISGYRAVHLILEVETRLGEEGTQVVPCEVQLRTMLQDAWARISHATLYRAKEDRRRHGEELRETATVLERCEELFQRVASGH